MERLAKHHAECHTRFEAIEQAMHAAAPLVPMDTPEGEAWHARYRELVAWREAMYDPAYDGDDDMIRAFLRDRGST